MIITLLRTGHNFNMEEKNSATAGILSQHDSNFLYISVFLCVPQFFEKLILSVTRVFTISILSVTIFSVNANLSVAKLFTNLVLMSS